VLFSATERENRAIITVKANMEIRGELCRGRSASPRKEGVHRLANIVFTKKTPQAGEGVHSERIVGADGSVAAEV